ncbi:type I pantothenate kinase [Henriciella mobilis]|uniref:type I pantothenate kinase n=1 Tax=Henriciella mobilis TaxID=2305467 RepID=UPI000E668ECC|nr:type I pantothenate kinase [Henriciella mobilis]RIJ14375.1 type I pantothenate kinase [Henriciella mobilis]RIJ19797.1 type I pantothenate kinase [Henriciella mobilis]
MAGHPAAPGTDVIAGRLAGMASPGSVLVIGLTGSVASGKTTLAGHVARHLSSAGHTSETVSTDGFLFPNSVLEARELTNRKGFPETYDRAAMAAAIRAVRSGPARFPGYSHETFDIDPALAREITRPDVLILEGLGLPVPGGRERGAGEPDLLVYLDADIVDLEAWYVERFVRFWEAAEHDPTSFYARFRHMTLDELKVFALKVWNDINRPNLDNHILPMRDHADIVVKKDPGHAVRIVEDRRA